MIWQVIMFFMIGQALNMSTAYWVILLLFTIFKGTFNTIKALNEVQEELNKINDNKGE